MSNPNDQNETGKNDDAGQKLHGLVRGACPECEETIPWATLDCPHCNYQRSFDQKQYDLLMRCSRAEDILQWNQWRRAERTGVIKLDGASLTQANLKGADLEGANLRGAELCGANLQGARLLGTRMQAAILAGANLQGAHLCEATLEGANLHGANLEGADLPAANLERADLRVANLQGAHLRKANLQGANLNYANLMGADASLARLDGGTVISECRVDAETDFTSVGLASACIEPRLRARLEYNIRRIGWRNWYKSHPLLAIAARPFWWASDYGRSTKRILYVFLLLTVFFWGLYYLSGVLCPPGMVENLFEMNGKAVPGELVPMRALYFSVVTMTTLGFGDIHANPQSHMSHIILSFHVLLGYVLLGALITRFAIMFQGVAVPWERPPPPKQETD